MQQKCPFFPCPYCKRSGLTVVLHYHFDTTIRVNLTAAPSASPKENICERRIKKPISERCSCGAPLIDSARE